MNKPAAAPPVRTHRNATDGTQAVARATALLRAIASSATGEDSLTELARALELERPTAYRILQRLVEDRLVEQNPQTRAYRLGPLVYELGLGAKPPLQLHALAADALTEIAADSGDTAFAVIHSGLDSVCIDRREGNYPVKALLMAVGRRRPLGIGAGALAMLSCLPVEQADAILDANATRIRAQGEVPTSELKQVVRQARAAGYAIKKPVDPAEILSLGVAVKNPFGTPVLGLSISALRFRIEQRHDLLVGLLDGVRRKVEKRLAEAHG